MPEGQNFSGPGKVCRRSILMILIPGALILFSGCQQKDVQKEKSAQEIISAAWKYAAAMDDSLVDYESSRSWLPGIRNLYAKIRPHIDLETFYSLSPEPVFLEGPHQQDFNLQAKTFGYYNPKFLAWAEDKIIPAQNHPQLRGVTQPFYDAFLKDMARVYYASYHHLEANPTIKEVVRDSYMMRIQEDLASGNETEAAFDGSGFFLQEELRQYPDQFQAEIEDQFGDMAWYYWVVSSGFWIRRNVDGTAGAFYDILLQLLNTYDADWISNPPVLP